MKKTFGRTTRHNALTFGAALLIAGATGAGLAAPAQAWTYEGSDYPDYLIKLDGDAQNAHAYNGKAHEPALEVVRKSDNEKLTVATPTYANNVNAGTATIAATVTDSKAGGEPVALNLTFDVAKATPTLRANGVVGFVGDKDLALAAVTSGDGAVTFEVTDGAEHATVDAKTGAVTLVSEGEATVTVTTAETDNYRKATATVKVRVLDKDAATHKVSFMANDGAEAAADDAKAAADKPTDAATGTMAEQTVAANDATPLDFNRFARAGYTFAGWNTEPDGKGTAYDDQASVTINEDLKLYAQWTAIAADKPAATEDANAKASEDKAADKTAADKPAQSTSTSGAKSSSSSSTASKSLSATASDDSSSDAAVATDTQSSGELTAQATGSLRDPKMTTNVSGTSVNPGDEVSFTITQKIPEEATNVRIWTELAPVLSYTSAPDQVVVRIEGGDAIVANVSIDGQVLTVNIGDGIDVATLAKERIEIVFNARVNADADFSAYLNDSQSRASIPYKASTEVQGTETQTAESSEKELKVSMNGGGSSSAISAQATETSSSSGSSSSGSGSSSSGSSSSSTSSRSSGTLSATGDPTSVLPLAAIATAGAGAVLAGLRKRR